MKKTISIIGSTGSIGLSSFQIIDKKINYFKINVLSANKNFKLINKQIKKYRPNFFIIRDYATFKNIKKRFKKTKTKILNDFNKISLKKKNDITISAIPGIEGLSPTISMISSSKKILIANKESIICGWNLIKKQALKNKTKIIPVDSEHFSILKLLENHKKNQIKKFFITASGGPFLNYKKSQLNKIKPKEALKHPKWKMGKKITIDSSTLMNKIFELVEAQKLFNIPHDKIDILIHPESLIHAIVVLKNGLTKFIYHSTSMIVPLANAIFDGNLDIDEFYLKKKKMTDVEDLTFKKPDKNIFPAFKLKNQANKYPSSSIIINGANEILVDQFLLKKIPFLAIPKIIMTILNDRNYRKYAIKKPLNINQINKIDFWAKKRTKEIIKINYD